MGHEIGRGTIAKVSHEAGVDPAPLRQKRTPWKEFLRTHWEVLAAADFFCVEVWTALGLVRYHVLFVIRLAMCEVHIAGIIPRLQWPKPVFKFKRAITAEEHAAIVAREQNAERRDFYELLWHTGASQTDAACLLAEDVDWNSRTISYSRAKLKLRGGMGIKPALIRFSDLAAAHSEHAPYPAFFQPSRNPFPRGQPTPLAACADAPPD